MKKRIWELDALRGLFILCMVAVHLAFDLVKLYKLVSWDFPDWFSLVMNWGGVLFFLISGICATLGSRSVRRGLIVFACGMICTAVTYAMERLGYGYKGLTIWFGVLHCLGVCMLLWPLFRPAKAGLLALLGVVLTALGLYLQTQMPLASGTPPYLVVLGIYGKGFASSDYFPLLPYLGFFLLGAFLGRTVYARKESLLPQVSAEKGVLGFLRLCGRHSLWIYLLHQPVLSLICSLWALAR